MSHFTVMVIGDNPEEQLAPYSEHIETEPRIRKEVSEEDKQEMIDFYKNPEKGGHEYPTFDELYENHGDDWNGNSWEKRDGKWVEVTTYNPNSKWDWYVLGGRWAGYFKLKEGAEGITGVLDPMTTPANPGYVDAALKKDIDFEGMKEDSAKEAGEWYDKVMNVIGHIEPNKPWSDFIKRLEAKEITIEEARSQYHTQPRIAALNTPAVREKLGYIFEADNYLVSREEYVKKAKNSSVATFAVLKDGKWYEKGEMGWFAMVANEKDQEQWNEEVAKLIDSLDDNTMISVYDCHI